MNKDELAKNLDYMRIDSAIKNKKGIAFIAASIILWLGILLIHLSPLPIDKKNLFTFCIASLLMPLAYLITKLLKISFSNTDNPINNLGFLMNVNQVLYLLIVCWVYSTNPEKMLMVLAMVFGAHLLPFSWLYKSKSYLYSSIIITISVLVIGCLFPPHMVAMFMLIYETFLTICLHLENKHLSKTI